jgi:hypothetical protein
MYRHMNYPTFTFLPFNHPFPRSPYPKVDTKLFEGSVKSFHILMDQANLLLNRLSDARFAYQIMDVAQQGKKANVERLVKSMGLQVPVKTEYTPSGIIFTLYSPATQTAITSCCALIISMKWGT